MTLLATPAGVLDHNDELFTRRLAAATAALDAGRPGAAAAHAQIAATFAWLNHTGRFASDALEALLGRLAAGLPATPPAARPRPGPGSGTGPGTGTASRHRVLHVMTEAYATGGHTQTVARWLAQDTSRSHRVVLTRQGRAAVPGKLADVLRDPRHLVRLDARPGDLLARAARLRRIAATADTVILHVHPDDVVPVVALAAAGLPPVVLVNHADHVFWVGTSVTTVLLNLRASGQELAIARRGVEAGRCAQLARPLSLTPRRHTRAGAKAALGLPPDCVLLTTAAAASKYDPLTPPGFLDLLVPVVERRPGVFLLAAGPSPDGAWAAAARRTGGRVRALGRLPDVTTLHEASDVYVDSYPFASLTSLLEATGFGTPAVTYRGHPPECLVLGADSPGLEEHLVTPGDPAALDRAIGRLVADEAFRLALGERTRAAVLDAHAVDAWRAGADRLHALAASLPARPSPGPASRGTGPLDVLIEIVQAQTGHAGGMPAATRQHLGLAPADVRLAQWLRGLHPARTAPAPSPAVLAPQWTLPHVAAAWRRTRSLTGRP